MLSNKNVTVAETVIVTELFIKSRKLKIFLDFITKSYFAVPKHITLNSTHYLIMKTPNNWQVQQIAFNHSSDINDKGFLNFYKKFTAKPNYLLVTDITLTSGNSLSFRENLL